MSENSFGDSIPPLDGEIAANLFRCVNGLRVEPPELSEIHANDDEMRFLAENVQQILRSDAGAAFSPEQLQTLELAVRALSNSAAQKLEDNDERETLNQIRILTAQLSETREHLLRAESQNGRLSGEIRELQAKHSESQDTARDYFERLTAKDAKINALRQEAAETQEKLKAELDARRDELQELRDRLKMGEFAAQRLTKALDDAAAENHELQLELTALRGKSEAQKKKARAAQAESHDLRLRVQEIEAQADALRANEADLVAQLQYLNEQIAATGTENLNNLTEERDTFRETLGRVQEVAARGIREMGDLRKEQLEAAAIIHRQQLLIAQYDSRFDALARDHRAAQDEARALRARVQDAEAQRDALSAQIESGGALERSLGDETCRRIRERFGGADLATAVDALLLGATNDELRAENERLAAVVENQMRFLRGAAARGVVDAALLSPDRASAPLIDEGAARDQMRVEMARTRQFLAAHNLRDPGAFASNLASNFTSNSASADAAGPAEYSGLELSRFESALLDDRGRGATSPLARSEFALSALLSQNNDILRRHCDRVMSENASMAAALGAAGDVVNFSGAPEHLPSFVAEKLLSFRQFAKRAQLALDGDFDASNYDDTLRFLTNYVHSSSSLIKQLDTDVRAAVRFEGELKDLPFFTAECVNDLLRALVTAREDSTAEMRAQLDQLRAAGDAEREKAAQRIAELEGEAQRAAERVQRLNDRLCAAQQHVDGLSADCEALDAQRADAEQRLRSVLRNYAAVEADLDAARAEGERLRAQGEQRQRAFEDRLEKVLGEERSQHSADLEQFERKLRAREERLRAELAAKSERLQAAKGKLREVVAAYEDAFRQQKEATAVLRQQNMELVARLQSAGGGRKTLSEGAAGAREEELRAEVLLLTAERERLEAQLQKTVLSAERERSARESFWEQQMSQREEDMSRSAQIGQISTENALREAAQSFRSALGKYAPEAQRDGEKGECGIGAACDAAKQVAERLEGALVELDALKKQRAVQQGPVRLGDQQRLQQVTKALQEWDRWARNLYADATDGGVPSQGTKELRYQIAEMVLASIGHRALTWRLECLRTQKKALVNGMEVPQKSEDPLCAKALVLYVLAAMRIVRRSGSYKPVFS